MSIVPSYYGNIGSAGGFPIPSHPSIQLARHENSDIAYDSNVSGKMRSIIAGPVGPYHSEWGGVTDDTPIRLFGGRLYTDSTLFVDIGAEARTAKHRMFQRGIPLLVLHPLDGRRTNVFSDMDVAPLGERQKESILIENFYHDVCMENYKPINIRILADTNFLEEGETENVFAHATSKTMEPVVTHAYALVKKALDENVPGLYDHIKHLYGPSSHGQVVAMTFDRLYVFPVVTRSNNILWIPLVNPSPDDVALIPHMLSRTLKTPNAKRCLSRVYYVGKLMEPYIHGEHGWIVSVECLQY